MAAHASRRIRWQIDGFPRPVCFNGRPRGVPILEGLQGFLRPGPGSRSANSRSRATDGRLSPSSLPTSRMADTTSVAVEAAPTTPSEDAIKRAAAFTREPFVLAGEDAAAML